MPAIDIVALIHDETALVCEVLSLLIVLAWDTPNRAYACALADVLLDARAPEPKD